MNPRPKIAKFVDTTCAACFARQNPVSTRANPACMKITNTAPMTTHSRFTWVPRISTLLGACALAGDANAKTPVTPRVSA